MCHFYLIQVKEEVGPESMIAFATSPEECCESR